MLSNGEWKGLRGEVDLCASGAPPPPANITGNLCPVTCITGAGVPGCSPQNSSARSSPWSSPAFFGHHVPRHLSCSPSSQMQQPKACGTGLFCFWELLAGFLPAVILAKNFFQVFEWLFQLLLGHLCPGSVFVAGEGMDAPCWGGKAGKRVLHVAPRSCSALGSLD